MRSTSWGKSKSRRGGVLLAVGRPALIVKDGSEEIKSPDGTTVVVGANGDAFLYFPNGQKEEHTSKYKVRVKLNIVFNW